MRNKTVSPFMCFVILIIYNQFLRIEVHFVFIFYGSKPAPDIEPIDLSLRSYIITKCVERIFLISSPEIMDKDETQTMLTLEHLCKQ